MKSFNIETLGYVVVEPDLSDVKQIIEKHSGEIIVESPSDIDSKEKP